MSKVDQIMLRYRPIAPKPVYGLSSVGVSVAPGNPKTRAGSKKRRYCGGLDKSLCGGGRKRKLSANRDEKMVAYTLPLLPETPDVKNCTVSVGLTESFPLCLKHEQHVDARRKESVNDGSWVKVECVTDKWDDCYVYDVMGHSDEAKITNLEYDTCPAFILDGLNHVRWINAAHKSIVAGEAVEVVMEEGVVLPVDCAAFTCRVRLITKENKYLILPADVCKMTCGWFAWRLDTKAALSLGCGI